MSVYTTADEKLDKAVELLNEAANCLGDATNKDTWGSSDWSEKYHMKLVKTRFKIEKLITKLDR